MGSPAHPSPQPPPQLGQQEGAPGCGDVLVHNTLATPAFPLTTRSPATGLPSPSPFSPRGLGTGGVLLGGDQEGWSDKLPPPRSRVGKGVVVARRNMEAQLLQGVKVRTAPRRPEGAKSHRR